MEKKNKYQYTKRVLTDKLKLEEIQMNRILSMELPHEQKEVHISGFEHRINELRCVLDILNQ